MTEHRLTRIVVAVSALVVAACVAVLTVRVMVSGFPLTVEYPRTYEGQELDRRVREALSAKGALSGVNSVSCPSDVTIKAGNTVTCDVMIDEMSMTVQVTVTDTDTGEVEVGDLQSG